MYMCPHSRLTRLLLQARNNVKEYKRIYEMRYKKCKNTDNIYLSHLINSMQVTKKMYICNRKKAVFKVSL